MATCAARPAARSALGWLWLLGLLAMPSAQAGDAWLPLNLPPRTEATWVMQQARVNGVPVQVQELHSELPPEELLQFFRRDWGRFGGLPALENTQRDWRKLTLQRDPVQLVMQVQPGARGGSHALLSQMNYRDLKRDYLPAGLPTLTPLQLTQVNETQDGARRSHLLQYSGQASFETVQQRLRQHWSRPGWRPVFDRAAGGQRQWLASFEKDATSVDIVLTQAGAREPLALTLNLLETLP